MGQNTVAILMALALQYLLMTLKVVALEKSLLVIQKILRLFVSTLPVKDKHYLLKRDNSDAIMSKKGDPHSLCISGNIGSKNMVR